MSTVHVPPETRYAASGEGAYIAYQVEGNVPPGPACDVGEFAPV